MPLCLEKLSHGCNVLTDPLNVSALALPTCTQSVPSFLPKATRREEKHDVPIGLQFDSVQIHRSFCGN